jgi:pimeloyl-ACP methyl ester carboxylesterase
MSRLSPEDRARAQEISALRRERPHEPLAELTLEYYNLLSNADNYDLDPGAEDGCVGFQNDVNKSVWAEVVELRESGDLERIVSSVSCPVVAIHGVYDPHPIDEVAGPLSSLKDFKLVPLEHCGHEPWKERQARDAFRLALLDAVSL